MFFCFALKTRRRSRVHISNALPPSLNTHSLQPSLVILPIVTDPNPFFVYEHPAWIDFFWLFTSAPIAGSFWQLNVYVPERYISPFLSHFHVVFLRQDPLLMVLSLSFLFGIGIYHVYHNAHLLIFPLAEPARLSLYQSLISTFSQYLFAWSFLFCFYASGLFCSPFLIFIILLIYPSLPPRLKLPVSRPKRTDSHTQMWSEPSSNQEEEKKQKTKYSFSHLLNKIICRQEAIEICICSRQFHGHEIIGISSRQRHLSFRLYLPLTLLCSIAPFLLFWWLKTHHIPPSHGTLTINSQERHD